jgi:hypothetical protein
LIPILRIRAGAQGEVTWNDFKFGESAAVPDSVSLPNRNFMNLLQLPLLFYVVCLMYYVTSGVDAKCLILAWSYVGLRFVHSGVHLTYNKVSHRMIVFAASNVFLVSLWIEFFTAPK